LAIKNKQVIQIGQGKNTCVYVHISDVIDLFFIVLDKIAKGELPDNGYYFAANGELDWSVISEEIARVLVAKGAITNSKIRELNTSEEILDVIGPHAYYDRSFRVTADKSRKIGWTPKYTTKDVLTSIATEADFLLAKK